MHLKEKQVVPCGGHKLRYSTTYYTTFPLKFCVGEYSGRMHLKQYSGLDEAD